MTLGIDTKLVIRSRRSRADGKINVRFYVGKPHETLQLAGRLLFTRLEWARISEFLATGNEEGLHVSIEQSEGSSDGDA